MAGLLDPRQGDGSYVENRPSKLAQTWGILGPYITDPFTGAINWTRDMMNADPYTLLADTGPRAQALAQGGAEVATNVMGAGSVVPKPDDALNMGFRVFHGSPHDFPPVRLIEMPDGRRLYQNMSELAETPQGARIIKEYPMGRFDLSKIGTGEGAQAYGHGLYFAGHEPVAKGYRDALSEGLTYQGKKNQENDGSPEWYAANHVMELMRAGLSPDQAIAETRNRYLNSANEIDLENGSAAVRVANVQRYRMQNAIADAVDGLLPNDFVNKPGHMYEVEIDADPDAFLDWDKPLSEQPEAVRKGFGSLVDRDLSKETGWAKMSGQQALDAIMERYGSLDWPDNADATLRQQYRTNARSKASALLADKGIPGIKYLDAGSRVPSAMAKKELADWKAQLSVAERELADATARGDQWLISRKQAEVKRVQDGIARAAKEAEGSRNYVVFDDNLINIIRKYGIAGLLGGSAAMDAMMSEPQNTQ